MDMRRSGPVRALHQPSVANRENSPEAIQDSIRSEMRAAAAMGARAAAPSAIVSGHALADADGKINAAFGKSWDTKPSSLGYDIHARMDASDGAGGAVQEAIRATRAGLDETLRAIRSSWKT